MCLHLMADCREAEEQPSHFLSWGKSLVSSERLREDCSTSESNNKYVCSHSKNKILN